MNLGSAFKPIEHKIKIITLIILLCLTISSIMIYSIINSINTDRVITSSIIEERLSKISELSTIKYNYSNIVALKDSKKFKDFPIPFTEKSFLIKYSGYIKAGVDLENLVVIVNEKQLL